MVGKGCGLHACLSGADYDVVDAEQLRLAVDCDMQSLVITLDILTACTRGEMTKRERERKARFKNKEKRRVSEPQEGEAAAMARRRQM